MHRLLALSGLAILCAFSSVVNRSYAADYDDPGPWGSISLNRHVVRANRLMREQRYTNARDEYLEAIAINPRIVDLYIGLHEACKKSPDWTQDLSALQKIFELEPTKKNQYAADYGIALYHTHRYDEAISWLKRALGDLNSATLPSNLPPTTQGAITIWKPPVEVASIGTNNKMSHTESPPGDSTTRSATIVNPVSPTTSNTSAAWSHEQFSWKPFVTSEERSKLAQNFEHACRSESVVVAEYLGYEKGDIHYNHPPKAYFRITKILKGPPLNKGLPVRFEFHDRISNEPPHGWKFSEKIMPAKNSEWILFIEHAVPRLGLFDTYEGSYGRQPATEENLNKVYAILEAHGETMH